MLARDRELPRLTRFRVLSRIGAGASGTVYRAHDAASDRIVALKVLHEATPAGLRALKNEFDALASVAHPNLVQLFEVGEERDIAYVAMELIEGIDFVRYVRPQPGAYQEKRLREALLQCVVGLDQLHAIGKVHRDIKPSNVRVTGEGRTVILDFGLLADAHAGLTLEMSDALQAGTAAYMAPEQAVGDPLSPATDLYALGVMLFQSLTGELPFNGSAHDIRVAKVSSPAPHPRARGLVLPDDLSALCVALLAMHPNDRPDARQLLTALGASSRVRDRVRRASLPPGSRIPFVGRASEIARLELLALREKTECQCLHLVGSTGIGKTALMREMARRFGERSDVIWLESTASSAQRAPYEGIAGIVEGLATLLVHKGVPAGFALDGAESLHELFPVLRRVSGLPHRLGAPSVPDRLERRWRALTALKHMLARVAANKHLVIWIDDWNHADVDTVRVAERLFRGRNSPPAMLVLASSPGDVALPMMERQVMVLGTLTHKESDALGHVLTRGDEAAEADLHTALEVSAGHPLHLLELLRLARSAGESSHSAHLTDTIIAHLSRLLPADRRLLELLSLIDTPLSAELTQIALGMPGQELGRSASQLSRDGWIVLDEASHSTLAMTHPALAQAVREHIDDQGLSDLHRALTDALSGGDLSLMPLLARHAVACERGELAADAALQVSRAALEVLSMDRAAGFHSMAAELTQQKDQLVQYQSARALAEALADAGRSVEAAYAYQLAYQTSNAANALDLHRRSAELFVHSGHMEEAGLSCIRDALSTVGESLPETGRAALFSLLKNRAVLRLRGLAFDERSVREVSARDLTRIDVLWSVGATLGMVDHVRGADFQARGLRYALRSGERFRVARALALEAGFSATTERAPHSHSRALLARAVELGTQRKDPYFEGLVELSRAMLSWSVADHEAYLGHALCAEQTLRAHCTDVVWEVTSSQQLTVASLQWLGRFRELDERVQRYQQEALERGSRHTHASLELFGGYVRVLCLDDPKNARARIKEAAALFPRDRFLLQHMAETMALSWIDQYEQHPINEARIVAARQGASRSYLLRTTMGQDVILNSEARLFVELGQRQPTRAKTQAKRLLQVAKKLRQLGIRTGQGEADLWTAHARALTGEMDKVPALLLSAERGCEPSAPGLALAIRYRRGRLLGGDEGKQLIDSVSRAWRAEGVRNVPRLVNAFAPAIERNE